jgi:hypothetical protein
MRSQFLFLGLVMLTADPTGAEPSAPMKPTGKWVVDYGETQCIATREYGSTQDPVYLAIRPAPSGDTYELLVARKRPGPTYAEELSGSVNFGHGPIKAWLLTYAPKNSHLKVHQFRVSADEMAQARSAKVVTFVVRRDVDTAFELESVRALLDGLSQCTDDLKRYWNMGDRGRAITTPAQGDVSVFRDEDFPDEALSRNQEGDSSFLLLVDEKGKVAGCHVAGPSGFPVFDVMGCQVIRERARFKPALDARGKAVRSAVETSPIHWRIAS